MKMRLILAAVALAALIGCQHKPADVSTANPETAPKAMTEAQTKAEIASLKEMIRKDPKNVDALIRLGNLSMDEQDYNLAAENYNKALEIKPDDADVRVDFGTCLHWLGYDVRSMQEYRRAIELDPNNTNAHLNLGLSLAFYAGDKEGAKAELEKYLELAPNAPNAASVKDEIKKLTGPPAASK